MALLFGGRGRDHLIVLVIIHHPRISDLDPYETIEADNQLHTLHNAEKRTFLLVLYIRKLQSVVAISQFLTSIRFASLTLQIIRSTDQIDRKSRRSEL
ncbi:hypothetical protein YC2023_097594 [Brassica napus]